MDLEHQREVESVQMHGETFDHSIQNKQAEVFAETVDDSPRSKDSSHESRSSSESEEQIYVISKVESDKNNHSDTHTEGTKSISSSARRRSSCSSSESSEEVFFVTEEAFQHTKSGKDYVSSSESSEKSEVDNNFLFPTSTNQDCNLDQSQSVMSPTASPPIQVMDRSGSYDASIIPSSIFEPTTNPLEWSIASNESLFSIQIGQPSFSREAALMYGELYSAMELTGELNNRAPSVILEEIPTVKNLAVEEKDTSTKNDVEKLQETTSHGSFKFEGERLIEDNNEIKTSHQTTSHKSSKSNASILSHSDNEILPVPSLKKRSRKGYGCSCSWGFCHLWPSCNGSSSCCWSTNPTKYPHQTSPILTEAEKTDSMKMDIPQQQSDKQEAEVVSASTASSCSCFQSKQEYEVPSNSKDNNSIWFLCFSCPCTWNPSSNCCCR